MPKKPPTPEAGNAIEGYLAPPEQRHPDNAPVADAPLVPDPTPSPDAQA